ncbi:IclR family transcriptional regulator [Pseudonocardia xinjiangensis]|uniref:IclR family transcriptional regulator n=1 Tax=Pseudonocardia xinjiangensis TaxID=75289 RepID=UPI003D8E197D
MPPSTEAGLSSVERALRMLEAVAEGPPLGATELAARLTTSKATAFRLARTLQANGYLEQLEDSRYRLGSRCLIPGARASSEIDLRHELRGAVEELHARTQETVLLTVLAGRFAVCLDSIPSTHPVVTVAQIGTVWPPHAVAGGLVILAADDDLRDEYLAGPLTSHSPDTITDPSALRKVLVEAREAGYAVNHSYLRPGVCAVGAAVRKPSGEAVAALSVMLPELRLRATGVETLSRVVRAVADRASHRLGRRPTTQAG